MHASGRDGYTSKMNEVLTEAMSKWWNTLTKEELLAYIADSPQITADVLRTILYNEELKLSVNAMFDTTTQNSMASFFDGSEE